MSVISFVWHTSTLPLLPDLPSVLPPSSRIWDLYGSSRHPFPPYDRLLPFPVRFPIPASLLAIPLSSLQSSGTACAAAWLRDFHTYILLVPSDPGALNTLQTPLLLAPNF